MSIALRLDAITFHHPDADHVIDRPTLDSVDLAVRTGEMVAVLGDRKSVV